MKEKNIFLLGIVLLAMACHGQRLGESVDIESTPIIDVLYSDQCVDNGCVCESHGDFAVRVLGVDAQSDGLLLSVEVGTACATHDYRVSACEDSGQRKAVVVATADCNNDGWRHATLRVKLPEGLNVTDIDGDAILVD